MKSPSHTHTHRSKKFQIAWSDTIVPLDQVVRFILITVLLVLSSPCLSSHAKDRVSGFQSHLSREISGANLEENLIDDDDAPMVHSARSVPLSPNTSSSILQQMGQIGVIRREWDWEKLNMANTHLFMIRANYSCSVPRPKLVRVLDRYPSASKKYVPRCTVLHQCDDEGGCCEDERYRCEPKQTEMVELYFHVIRSDMKNNITGGSAAGIEKLTFLNHTKCECKPINYMPRSEITRPPIHYSKPSFTKPPSPKQLHQSSDRFFQDHRRCTRIIQCPEPFEPKFRSYEQRCVCDCTTDELCLEIQAGIRKLQPEGVRCVLSNECAEPACAFTLRYNRTESQCLTERSSRHLHHFPHHRRHIEKTGNRTKHHWNKLH